MTHEQQIAHFKNLTETVLPTLASTHHWPIRLDHCFKRICLDAAFKDVWYNHLKRPAERHIQGEPLALAIAAAELLTQNDRADLTRLNQASLRYRGKLH